MKLFISLCKYLYYEENIYRNVENVVNPIKSRVIFFFKKKRGKYESYTIIPILTVSKYEVLGFTFQNLRLLDNFDIDAHY